VLAFNLGVFFRNLSGAEVDFTAANAQCEFQFVGFVQDLQQHRDVGTRLSVALRQQHLTCSIEIEEEETIEAPEDAKIDVRLVLRREEGDRELLHATFRFEEISLKPHAQAVPAEAVPEEEPPPKAS
jgi:hypothetical protein